MFAFVVLSCRLLVLAPMSIDRQIGSQAKGRQTAANPPPIDQILEPPIRKSIPKIDRQSRLPGIGRSLCTCFCSKAQGQSGPENVSLAPAAGFGGPAGCVGVDVEESPDPSTTCAAPRRREKAFLSFQCDAPQPSLASVRAPLGLQLGRGLFALLSNHHPFLLPLWMAAGNEYQSRAATRRDP